MAKGYKGPPEHIAKRGFHGTDYDYTGEVLPNSRHGNRHFQQSGEHDTYFLPARSENERHAWMWSSGEASGVEHTRRRVHVTEPQGEQHIDRNLHGSNRPYADSEYNTYARVAPKQKIIDTLWAPPPGVNETHVESTLPHINWRQHGAPNYLTHHDGGYVLDDHNNQVVAPRYVREHQAKEADEDAQAARPAYHANQQTLFDAGPPNRATARERRAQRADWELM